MAKNPREDLNQQNKLLQKQNDLLEQNNQLLQQVLNKKLEISTATNEEEFVENINEDEMRDGFLVNSHRKKLWNVQIGLINEFARICKKHNLPWFAYGGTLLGAARHKGFIPWDDDVDLGMLRSDYEKFKQIAATEIKEPYYLDLWYNYRYEGDKVSNPAEVDLPMITIEEKKRYNGWWPFFPILKIRDSRTLILEFPNRKTCHQGIWIDIFPLDPSPPFANNQQAALFQAKKILMAAAVAPNVIEEALANNQKLVIETNALKQFLNNTHRQKGIYLDNFMIKNFYNSEYVKHITLDHRNYKTENFRNLTYLPFEKIEMPVPVNYDEVLSIDYGDWHKMVYTHSHSMQWSSDISYKEYFKSSAF